MNKINKLNRNILRYKNKRNKRNINKKYLRLYQPRLTTFGPGSQFIIISKLAVVQADTVQTYSLNNAMNNKEWSKVEYDFMFFKIERIALIFLPRVYPTATNQDSLYVNINYTSKQIEVPSLQDNTQMIPPYLPKSHTLLYRVPHVSVDGITLNAWLDHGDFLEMTNKICFTMSSPDNSTGWNFRLEIGIKCRLPTNPEDTKYKKQYIGFKSRDNATDYKEAFSVDLNNQSRSKSI